MELGDSGDREAGVMSSHHRLLGKSLVAVVEVEGWDQLPLKARGCPRAELRLRLTDSPFSPEGPV